MDRKCKRSLPIFRCMIRGLLLAGVIASVWPAKGDAAPVYAGWFRHSEHITGAWTFTEVGADPQQVMIKSTVTGEGKPKRILVLYPKRSSAYDIAMSKILDVFASKNMPIEFQVINFNNDDGLGAEVLDLAEEDRFDLIFSMGSESTAWLYQYYRNGDTPVVTVCSKDPVALGHVADYENGSGTNFAFTSLNMPTEVQVAYLMDFMPGLKNLGILVARNNISAVRTQAKPMQEAVEAKGINAVYLAVQDPANAKEELPGLIESALVEMRKTDPSLDHSMFWITGATSVFREIETINQYAGPVPVLSAVPEVVQAGDKSAVMSIGISFESNGYLAAVYGYDVLMGKTKAGDLKVGIVSPPDIAINFRRARAIGVEVPFSFFESANYVYDYEGNAVRLRGRDLTRNAGS
ncbi:MAG: ABC transporter substrate binding protein [Alphaproteobacteria bacterium]